MTVGVEGARITPKVSRLGVVSAAVLILGFIYAASTATFLWSQELFGYIGGDFKYYVDSAQLAREHGIAEAYRVNLFPYPPPFLVLIQPFTFIPPSVGLVIWTTGNVLALIGCAAWLLRRTQADPRVQLLICLVFSLPVLDTIRGGQTNLLLFVALGAFLGLGAERADFRAGLWLSGMLMKPQTLILLLPGLVIGRRWRMLAGFSTGAFCGLLLAVIAGGPDAILANIQAVALYPSGAYPGTTPEPMPNWRALGYHLSHYLPDGFAWGVAILGLAASAVLALLLWRDSRNRDPRRFEMQVLGTYAATTAVAWHSLMSTAVPLAAPLLLLTSEGRVPVKLLAMWLLAPYIPIALRFVDLSFENELALMVASLCLLAFATRWMAHSADSIMPPVAATASPISTHSGESSSS